MASHECYWYVNRSQLHQIESALRAHPSFKLICHQPRYLLMEDNLGNRITLKLTHQMETGESVVLSTSPAEPLIADAVGRNGNF